MKAEISNGEVLDKVSILEIKFNNIKNEGRQKHVALELKLLLEAAVDQNLDSWFVSDEYKELLEVNQALWIIEDKIRLKEHKKEFDEEFIELARSVYIVNDKRADIKRLINENSKSLLVEVKVYKVKYEPKTWLID